MHGDRFKIDIACKLKKKLKLFKHFHINNVIFVYAGNSWKSDVQCADVTSTLSHTCEDHENRKSWAMQSCNILKSKAFEACHGMVIIKSCKIYILMLQIINFFEGNEIFYQ